MKFLKGEKYSVRKSSKIYNRCICIFLYAPYIFSKIKSVTVKVIYVSCVKFYIKQKQIEIFGLNKIAGFLICSRCIENPFIIMFLKYFCDCFLLLCIIF